LTILLPLGMQSTVISVSVCLRVHCHISKITRPNFTRFSAYVNCGCGSVLLWRQCNISCSVDDVMFARNRWGNGNANRAHTLKLLNGR